MTPHLQRFPHRPVITMRMPEREGGYPGLVAAFHRQQPIDIFGITYLVEGITESYGGPRGCQIEVFLQEVKAAERQSDEQPL